MGKMEHKITYEDLLKASCLFYLASAHWCINENLTVNFQEIKNKFPNLNNEEIYNGLMVTMDDICYKLNIFVKFDLCDDYGDATLSINREPIKFEIHCGLKNISI